MQAKPSTVDDPREDVHQYYREVLENAGATAILAALPPRGVRSFDDVKKVHERLTARDGRLKGQSRPERQQAEITHEPQSLISSTPSARVRYATDTAIRLLREHTRVTRLTLFQSEDPPFTDEASASDYLARVSFGGQHEPEAIRFNIKAHRNYASRRSNMPIPLQRLVEHWWVASAHQWRPWQVVMFVLTDAEMPPLVAIQLWELPEDVLPDWVPGPDPPRLARDEFFDKFSPKAVRARWLAAKRKGRPRPTPPSSRIFELRLPAGLPTYREWESMYRRLCRAMKYRMSRPPSRKTTHRLIAAMAKVGLTASKKKRITMADWRRVVQAYGRPAAGDVVNEDSLRKRYARLLSKIR